MTTVALSIIVIVSACVSRGEKKKVDTTALSTQPAVVTPVETSGEVDTIRRTPLVVTFASAQASYTQGKYAEAEESFDAYVKRHTDNAFGFYMLGLSAWKHGDLDRARAALEQSLTLDSTNVKTMLNLGRVLLEKGHPDDALVQVESAVNFDSGSAEVHRMKARVQSALGRRDSAEVSYRLALSIDPNDSWSMNNLGLLLIDDGRYEEALKPLARAVELRPESPAFANNLGVALERTGHAGSAAMAYQSALVADSTYTKAQKSLARVTGKTDETPIVLAQLAAQFNDSLQTSSQVRMSVKPER
ncbi:MAG TPA: tetratricopeptide repeat protein [Gemmatimonadaceae bacterium]|nr:tetratricopeptide repeat protein [Gemmatimonadaceae bacterium]